MNEQLTDMEKLAEWLKVLGGIAGLIALVWRFVDEFGAYLRISVEVSGVAEGRTTVLVTIDNKGNRPKEISYACLLLGPESERPIETANILVPGTQYKEKQHKEKLTVTNEIQFLRAESPVYIDGRALIPLPFFYSENVDIADETLTYRSPIDAERLAPNSFYAARFYVFAENRLHRSTQDCFYNGGQTPNSGHQADS
jgi:hypothetical protein